jgi:hypothetical protein
MVSTCGLGRLLSGGAMGFVGASPFHHAFVNWVGAAVGVGAVYFWTRWMGHATACDVASGPRERVERDDARATDEPV